MKIIRVAYTYHFQFEEDELTNSKDTSDHALTQMAIRVSGAMMDADASECSCEVTTSVEQILTEKE